jgi:hypothetical protein
LEKENQFLDYNKIPKDTYNVVVNKDIAVCYYSEGK